MLKLQILLVLNLIYYKVISVLIKRRTKQEAIQSECTARKISFDNETKWSDLINFIKQHEQDNKYFIPRIEYYTRFR